ncbi:MAG: uroporphyrinogen decarboxylase family protein, partial [Candidatus Latescibacterota bacterium]
MTSRERVLTALRHEEPDLVPFNMRVCEELLARWRERTGDPAADWCTHWGHDVRPMEGFAVPPCPPGLPREEWTPPVPPAEVAATAGRVRSFQEAGIAICSGYQMGIFEQAKDWLGDVETLTLPLLDAGRCELVLDRVTEWKMAVYGAWVKTGVDVVWIGDDLGTQRSLVMSPAAYRRWYRPRHQRLIAHLKGINPQVRVAFHCCGHVTPLIPDLIEIGVEVLEAVQAEAMDLAFLKREYGREIAFWGGIGAQSVLARRSREEVVEGVRRTLEVMMPGGGYIAAPCHTLTEEVT